MWFFFLPGNLDNCSTLLLQQKSDGRFLCLQVCICCSPWQRRWVTPSRSLLSYGTSGHSKLRNAALMAKAWSQTPAHYGLFCLPRRKCLYIFSYISSLNTDTSYMLYWQRTFFSDPSETLSHKQVTVDPLCFTSSSQKSEFHLSLNLRLEYPYSIGPLSDKILAYYYTIPFIVGVCTQANKICLWSRICMELDSFRRVGKVIVRGQW